MARTFTYLCGHAQMRQSEGCCYWSMLGEPSSHGWVLILGKPLSGHIPGWQLDGYSMHDPTPGPPHEAAQENPIHRNSRKQEKLTVGLH